MTTPEFLESFRAAQALKTEVQTLALRFLDLGLSAQAVKLGQVAQSIKLPAMPKANGNV